MQVLDWHNLHVCVCGGGVKVLQSISIVISCKCELWIHDLRIYINYFVLINEKYNSFRPSLSCNKIFKTQYWAYALSGTIKNTIESVSSFNAKAIQKMSISLLHYCICSWLLCVGVWHTRGLQSPSLL